MLWKSISFGCALDKHVSGQLELSVEFQCSKTVSTNTCLMFLCLKKQLHSSFCFLLTFLHNSVKYFGYYN